jgi:tripartite-type tricarboxylate transporter receptor subunit TctC
MAYSYTTKLVGCAVGMSLAWLGTAAAQQSVEDFYKGKTVTLVVSAAPGGGADFYARELAPYLAKHIPGKPNLVITNVAGAAGLTAGIRLQTRDPKDGTVIASLQVNNLYVPLLSDQKIEFDPRQVSWIGSVNKETYTVAVAINDEVKTTDDIFKKKIRMGATTFGNVNRVIPVILNEYYGAKFDVVTGFPGADEAWLAMQRGEIQGRMIPVDSLMSYGGEAEWIKNGKMKVLLQTAITPSKTFDAPNIFDLTKDPEVIALTRFFLAPLDAGRPFAVPKGVPADRLAALRKAFMDAIADPEYKASMAKTGAKADPITGEQIESIVKELYAASPSVIAKAKKLTNPPK